MILLDTHIWLRWLLSTEPLPIKLVEQIEQTETVTIFAISCWEVVMLVQKQRIELPLPVEQWLKDATTNSFVSVLPITCDISRLAGTLPEHHKDPADRIIIATALCHNLKLMSLDSIFPAYQEIAERLIVK
jgi:PIN domain nuclease of toxin-antitoxin system